MVAFCYLFSVDGFYAPDSPDFFFRFSNDSKVCYQHEGLILATALNDIDFFRVIRDELKNCCKYTPETRLYTGNIDTVLNKYYHIISKYANQADLPIIISINGKIRPFKYQNDQLEFAFKKININNN